MRQQTAIPLGALVGRVRALFRSQIARRFIRVECNRLHHLIVEIDCCVRLKRKPLHIQGVLQSHHPKPNGTMTGICRLSRLSRIKINVDNIIQRTDSHSYCFPQFRQIQRTIRQNMSIQNNGTQITDCSFIFACIESDLRAQIRAVNDPNVILGTSYVAGVLKGDPRMPRLEQHREHSLPNLNGRHLMPPNLALLRLLLIRLVPLLKFLSVQMMKISCIASPEEGPIPSGFHPLHE